MEKPRRSESSAHNRLASAEPVDDDSSAAASPAAAFSVFVLMEDLIDKLKLLDYESQFAKEFNIPLLPK